MKLIHGGKKTNAYYALAEAKHPSGAEVTRRKKGFTNYDVLMDLRRQGFVEIKPSGPKGGQRFHATPAGLAALAAIPRID